MVRANGWHRTKVEPYSMRVPDAGGTPAVPGLKLGLETRRNAGEEFGSQKAIKPLPCSWLHGFLLNHALPGQAPLGFGAFAEEAALTGAKCGEFHRERKHAGEEKIAGERVPEEQQRRRKFRAAHRHRLPPAGSVFRIKRIPNPRVGVRRQIENDCPRESAAEKVQPVFVSCDEAAE